MKLHVRNPFYWRIITHQGCRLSITIPFDRTAKASYSAVDHNPERPNIVEADYIDQHDIPALIQRLMPVKTTDAIRYKNEQARVDYARVGRYMRVNGFTSSRKDAAGAIHKDHTIAEAPTDALTLLERWLQEHGLPVSPSLKK